MMGLDLSTVDVAEYEPPADRPAPAAIETDYDLRALTDAVFSLPPQYYCDYDNWVKVGMALKSTDPGLLYLWDKFSQQSFADYRSGDCERKWSTFSRREGGLTAGSIFRWARESVAIKTEQPRFEGWGFQEFLKADFHQNYLVEGVLVESESGIVGGPQKALKTLSGLDLSIGLATGSYFLTPDYPCLQRRVAFFSGESAPGTLQERASAISRAKGVDPTNEQLRIYRTLPRFDRPLDELKKLLVENGTQFLFIDPAYMAMDGTEASNAFTMYPQLGAISNLCSELGITFLLAHHVTKSAGREHSPLDLYDLAHAGFGEWARQWLLHSRRSSFQHDGKHQLYLVAGGSAGHDKLLHVDVNEGMYPDRHWTVSVQSKGEAAAEANEQHYLADAEKIRVALKTAGEPLVKDRLYRAAGISYARFNSICSRMVDDGAIKVIEGRYIHYTLGDNQNG